MLEIIGIAFLASINGKNAAARGQKPLKYQLLTLALWVGAEILGGLIGSAMSGGELGPTYILALIGAAGGGVASYFIAKNAKQGSYLPTNYGVPVGATPLATPATLTIVRKKSPVAMLVTYTAFVNGIEVGKLKNGESVQMPLTLTRNSLLIKDAYGNQQTPLVFSVAGPNPTIVFNSQSTVRGECFGVTFDNQVPLPTPGQAQAAPVMGAAPTAGQAPAAPVVNAAPAPGAGVNGFGVTQTEEPAANPMLAVYVLAGTLVLMLLTMIISWRGNMRAFDSISQYLSLSFVVVLAVSIYLLMESDSKYKIIAGGGLVLGAFLRSLAYAYLLAFAQLIQRPRLGLVFANATFGINLRNSLITVVIVAAVALIVAATSQGPKQKKLLLGAGITAGITFIYGLFNLRHAMAMPSLPGVMKFGFVFNQLAVALCLVFFVLLIAWICRIYEQPILPSKGAKIWFGVCAGLTTIAAIANLATASMGINGAVVGLVGVGGYVLLFLNKRVGFPVVLWAVTMTVVAGMCVGFNGRTPSMGLGLAPVLGFLNPLITWLVIRGVWGKFDLMGGSAQVAPMPAYTAAPVGGAVPTPPPVTPVPIIPVGQPVTPVTPAPTAAGGNQGELRSAARKVFNNSFSSMVFDPEDKLWKEPIQPEIDTLVAGGEASVPVLEQLLMECAAGRGPSISSEWWYGSEWAVKVLAMLPVRPARAALLNCLRRDSNIAEWFTHVQRHAATQLGNIGDAGTIRDLENIVAAPLSMTPVDEINRAIDRIEERQAAPPAPTPVPTPPVAAVPETDDYAMPEDIIKKGKTELGDEDGIDYLLTFGPEVPQWDAKDQGHYYYTLARKAERLGHEEAATAFNIAQCIAFPDKGTLGYKRLAQAGYDMSPGALAALQGEYPLPTSLAEVAAYQPGGLVDEDYDPFAAEEEVPPTVVETTPEVIPEAEPEPEPVTADPTSMTADELIDFMTTPAAAEIGLASLGSTLLYKLQDNFYARPQDVEKTLRTFGDESMVSRFNMIKNTMKPSDLDLLIPDLLYKYTMARR